MTSVKSTQSLLVYFSAVLKQLANFAFEFLAIVQASVPKYSSALKMAGMSWYCTKEKFSKKYRFD